MHTASALPVICLAMVGLMGCVTEAAEEVGTAESAVVDTNGLATNGLATNGLATNGLATNGLATNGLTAGALAAIEDPGSTGDLNRQFLKYAVGCAFTSSQSFSFSWTDSSGVVHNETYAGLLGLAPSWASGPLDDSGQRLVSACLAARTNYFGVTVTISMRADVDILEDATTQAELGQYSYVEGAFWGNLFASTPYLSACYKSANVDHSRAAQRDCAAGYIDGSGAEHQCGMINILGDCSDICRHFQKNGGYYTGCYSRHSDDVNFDDVLITVGLQ